MNQLLVFISGLILGGVIVWFRMQKPVATKDKKDSSGKLEEFNKEREKERTANKQKILELISGVERVANDEVEKLLSVSDATAERYLDELEKEGRIKQVGRTGHCVYYQKT